MRPALLPLLALAAFSALGLPAAGAAERIVTAGANVTEIVYALGRGASVVGADSSSVYPAETAALPKVGYARQLSAEGVLSLAPTLFLCTSDAGPESALEQIAKAGAKVVRVDASHDVGSACGRIREIGAALGIPEKGDALAESVRKEIDAATGEPRDSGPSVLFIYARGGGTLNVSGSGTAAAAMIELAGGRNAISAYDGYKPLTAEAALAASPDVILLTTRGLEAAGGIDGLLQVPGLAETPAGKNRRVVAMDDVLLLGFGPRLGVALRELGEQLHRPASQLAARAAAPAR